MLSRACISRDRERGTSDVYRMKRRKKMLWVIEKSGRSFNRLRTHWLLPIVQQLWNLFLCCFNSFITCTKFFYNIKSHRWSKASKKGGRKHKKNLLAFMRTKKCLCEMSCKASLSSSSDISLNLRFHEEKKFCSVSNFFTVRRRWWRRKKKKEMMRKRSKYKVIKITKQRGVRERAFFM